MGWRAPRFGGRNDVADPDDPDEDAPSSPDLVLDELDEKFAAFQAFRKSDKDATNSILGDLGASDDVDRDIVLELSSPDPLGHPDRFPEAHALVMRALEVLDRNGIRGPSVKARWLGPLRPVAVWVVGLVTQFIVRRHQARIINALVDLYARREANCSLNDPSLRSITRARVHAERLAPGFRRNPLGVPTFLLGGAILSSAVSALQRFLVASIDALPGQIAVSLALFAVILGIGWAILLGSAAARRRIHLTLDKPLAALYQTIGRCGEPPRDQSRIFALIAIILILVSGFVVPLAFLVAWLVG